MEEKCKQNKWTLVWERQPPLDGDRCDPIAKTDTDVSFHHHCPKMGYFWLLFYDTKSFVNLEELKVQYSMRVKGECLKTELYEEKCKKKKKKKKMLSLSI